MKCYDLISVIEKGETYYQIIATEEMRFSFPDKYILDDIVVTKGEKGGYVTDPECLASDKLWLSTDTLVTGSCRIIDSYIDGGSLITGYCRIKNSYVYNSCIQNISDIIDSYISYLFVENTGEVSIVNSLIWNGNVSNKNNYIKDVILEDVRVCADTEIFDKMDYLLISNMPFTYEDKIVLHSFSLNLTPDGNLLFNILSENRTVDYAEFYKKFLPEYKHYRRNAKMFLSIIKTFIQERKS